ncbi:hypothetical protein L1887_62754 [Cichorium endivia]|nr:hypothetical protein L1887_62754 [Cichorium endivia]
MGCHANPDANHRPSNRSTTSYFAAVIPALLAVFADTASLMFEGGPTQVGMLFDWRQLAGEPTYDWSPPSRESWNWNNSSPDPVVDPAMFAQWNLDNVWINTSSILDHHNIIRLKAAKPNQDQENDDASVEEHVEHWEWSHTKDSARSWTLILTWLATIPLGHNPPSLPRSSPNPHPRPHCHFSPRQPHRNLPLHKAGPNKHIWWGIMLTHAAATVVLTEQAAIKRELNRSVGYNLVGGADDQHTPDGLGRPTGYPPQTVVSPSHKRPNASRFFQTGCCESKWDRSCEVMAAALVLKVIAG